MQNQLLGAFMYPPQVGHEERRNVPRPQILSSAHAQMSALMTAEGASGVSRYRRVGRDSASPHAASYRMPSVKPWFFRVPRDQDRARGSAGADRATLPDPGE